MLIKSAILATLFSLLTMHGLVFAKSDLFENEAWTKFKPNEGERIDAIEGHFFVPENRNSATSRKIRVNYVRFPGTGKSKGAPIIYLAGGPGGSGIGTAKWRRFPLFMALREYSDVIALDQRGTGQSEQAPRCVSDEKLPLTEKLAPSQVKLAYVKAAKQCFEFWQQKGFDVYGYTTVQNALDIESLRKHLHADKVTLWGISYGSHLAFAAMKLFPERIEKVIIASAEGLNQTVKLPAMTDDYFKRVQQIIDQQPLKKSVPDLTELMKRVHTKLDKTPIPLKIKSKEGAKTELLFQTGHLRMLASMMIADPNQYLAMLIHIYLGLDNDSTELLESVLQRGVFNEEIISFSLMPLAMDVASGITPKRLALVSEQAKSALLSDVLNFPMPMLNMFDTNLDLGEQFRVEPKNDIPTLLFSGTLDGRTYLSEQTEAASGLTNLSHVTVKHAGHNLYMSSPEILEIMKTFLSDKVLTKSSIALEIPNLSLQR